MSLLLHVPQRGVRAFGISESFVKGGSEHAVLVGVVMRTDTTIDEVVVSQATVGGMDATEKIIEMYHTLGRGDIDLLLLNGFVISWYNVVDLHKVAGETGLLLICVTYNPSGGLEKYFVELFPTDRETRVAIYRRNRSRVSLVLDTGYTIYMRPVNMNVEEAAGILNTLTRQGSIPEPLRVARLLARSIVKAQTSNSLARYLLCSIDHDRKLYPNTVIPHVPLSSKPS